MQRLSRDPNIHPRNAMRALAIAARERPWDDVDFRTENGITALFTLIDRCSERYASKDASFDVHAMCHELVTSHRSYIVHNESIQMTLCRMIFTLRSVHEETGVVDALLLNALRGTLRGTIVPFCLFVHDHMCDDTAAVVREVLTELVFAEEAGVLRQWTPWNDAAEDRVASEKTCPITLEPIVDGVVASDGHLYERSALLTHLLTRRESPMTREYLDLDLVPLTSAR